MIDLAARPLISGQCIRESFRTFGSEIRDIASCAFMRGQFEASISMTSSPKLLKHDATWYN